MSEDSSPEAIQDSGSDRGAVVGSSVARSGRLYPRSLQPSSRAGWRAKPGFRVAGVLLSRVSCKLRCRVRMPTLGSAAAGSDGGLPAGGRSGDQGDL